MKIKHIIFIESAQPYRTVVLTDKGIRAARPGETLKALWTLHQNGNFGILRLVAICIKKLTMSLFRSSQQQLFTPTETTPELLSTFKRWEKAMEGSHDLPQ